MSESFISTNLARISPRSFLSDETSIEDVHGHGTHATALLLRVAENADLYVARIAKKENFLDPKSIERVRFFFLINVEKENPRVQFEQVVANSFQSLIQL